MGRDTGQSCSLSEGRRVAPAAVRTTGGHRGCAALDLCRAGVGWGGLQLWAGARPHQALPNAWGGGDGPGLHSVWVSVALGGELQGWLQSLQILLSLPPFSSPLQMQRMETRGIAIVVSRWASVRPPSQADEENKAFFSKKK